MKIRNYLLAFLICSTTAFAFTASIAQTGKRMDQGNAIYSYNSSIKDAVKVVVNISTSKKVKQELNAMLNDPFFRQFFGDLGMQIPKDRVERSLGSGVIISNDGYIITNNHVISGADKITVAIPNMDKEYTAKIVGQDSEGDLAVIKIEAKNLPFIKFANSNEVLVGDIVFAIGNPFGVGETVTQGIVSALNKTSVGINNYENFIQTDASINPGNSGGALVDTMGNLIGINTAIISRTGGNHGVGFAIPSNMVLKIATSLINTGSISRGYLGVGIKDITAELKSKYGNSTGAIVINVENDSPAAKAGLKIWDLITKVNDTPIKNSSQLRNVIALIEPNKNIEVTFIRDGVSQKANIKLANRKTENSQEEVNISKLNKEVTGSLNGLSVDNITYDLRNKLQLPKSITGVIVTNIAPESPASKLGIEEGDIISQVEDFKISSTASLSKALNALKGKEKRILIYSRQGIKTIIVR